MACYSVFKGRTVRIVFLGATFICCGLIIYNMFSHYKIMCLSLAACSMAYQSESARLSSENCTNVCFSKECIEIANGMLNLMNFSASPCTDFRSFACGNYGDKFERGSNHSLLGTTLVDEINLVIKDIIETSKETQVTGSSAQKLKIVYDSCMDSKFSDFSALQSMVQFLGEMGIPNWPYLGSNFSFENTTLEETIGKLATFQEYMFVRFLEAYTEIFQRKNDDKFNITVVLQNPTYNDDSEAEKLKNVVMGILQYTGMNNTDINQTWEDFMEVENGIRTLLMNNSEEDNICEGKVWADCSHENASENMLCRVWESVVRNGRISAYYSKDRVEIGCRYKYYTDKLPTLLNSYNQRSLAHYMALRVVINNLKYLNFPIRKNLVYVIQRPYSPMERDDEEKDHTIQMDRWKFCVSWIAGNMKFSLGHMYVNRVWGKDKTDELDDIVNEYKQTTIQFIEEQDWIDDNTKIFAVKHVKEVRNLISLFITLLKNRTRLDEEYLKFHPSRNNFFRNVMYHRNLHFIRTSAMKDDDAIFQSFSAYVVQARARKDIYMTFGILLPPVFKQGYPKLFNIAKLGQIIGHEMGHIFMNILGSDYGTEISNETTQHFNEKVECIIDQYFNYEMKLIKQNVKGNNTIRENLADMMAVKLTEKIAEQIIRNMNENNFALPGSSFSPEELLYISYAQTWCEIRSIEKEYHYFEKNVHSPPEYRLLGPLQNSERFSEVFHCPPASYMNPTKKCIILN